MFFSCLRFDDYKEEEKLSVVRNDNIYDQHESDIFRLDWTLLANNKIQPALLFPAHLKCMEIYEKEIDIVQLLEALTVCGSLETLSLDDSFFVLPQESATETLSVVMGKEAKNETFLPHLIELSLSCTNVESIDCFFHFSETKPNTLTLLTLECCPCVKKESLTRVLVHLKDSLKALSLRNDYVGLRYNPFGLMAHRRHPNNDLFDSLDLFQVYLDQHNNNNNNNKQVLENLDLIGWDAITNEELEKYKNVFLNLKTLEISNGKEAKWDRLEFLRRDNTNRNPHQTVKLYILNVYHIQDFSPLISFLSTNNNETEEKSSLQIAITKENKNFQFLQDESFKQINLEVIYVVDVPQDRNWSDESEEEDEHHHNNADKEEKQKMVGRIHHSMDGLLQYTAHLPFIQKVDASGSKLNSLDFFFRLPSLHILNIGGCDYLDEEELNTLWKVRKEETHPHLKYIYTDCEKMNPALKEYLEKQDIEAENNNNEKVNEFHKREITKFIPAHLVAPSLLQDTDQKSHHKNINKNELTASALRDSLQNNDTNENREDGVSSLDSPAFSSSRSSSSWSSEEDDNRSKDETPENEDNKDSHNNTFLKPHSYSTKSVLDFNRGVASSLSSLFGEKEKKMEPNKKNEKKKNTLPSKYEFFGHTQEVDFPSCEPQLFFSTFYRNDLLVRVTCTKKLKRRRSKKTGEIIFEEEVSDDEDEQNRKSKIQKAEVVGVVSRSVEINRPADFCLERFSEKEMEDNEQYMKTIQKQKKDGSSLEYLHTDFLQPYQFSSVKAPPVIPYEGGYHLNRTVGELVQSSLNNQNNKDDEDESLPVDNNNNEEDENANENLTVSVTASLPPERTAAQLVVLRDSFHASPTGLSPNDPTEVRTFVLLLYLHPVWSAKLLERLCTRCMPLLTIHAIKRMTFAYTYSVERGPFHRLRLRYNFNPYEGEQYSNNVKKVNIKDSLFCQLNSLRIHRTSPLGVRVRDLARSPQLAHVIALIRRVNYETAKAALQSAAETPHPLVNVLGEDAVREMRSLQVRMYHYESESTDKNEDVAEEGLLRLVREKLSPFTYQMIDHFCVSLLEGNLNLYYVYYMLRGDTFCETLFEDCVQRHYTEHERKRNEAKNNQNGNEVAMKQKDSPCGWLSPKETDALRSYVQGLYTNFVEDVVSFLLNLLQEKS